MRIAAAALERECCAAIEATTHEAFSAWLSRQSDAVSADGANKRRARLLALARWCRKYGLVRTLHIDHAPRFEHAKRARETIPLADLPKYISACSVYSRLPVLMLLVTALRNSEVCGLRLDQIAGDEYTVIKKGGKPLARKLTPAVRDILAQAQALRDAHKNPSREYVFFNARGTAWTADSLDKRWKKDLKKSNLRHRHLHELRHTVSTLAGKKFMPREVQALLGHEQLSTSDIYHHSDASTAATVQDGIFITYLSHLAPFFADSTVTTPPNSTPINQQICCPKCGHNFIPANKKGRKSK